MPRPKVKKIIKTQLKTRKFTPVVDPRMKHDLNTGSTRLEGEEIEALRLVDRDNLNQTEAGERMGTSQSTVQRIVKKARKKLIDALLNAKTIEL